MPSRQTTRLSRDIRRRDVPSLLDALAPPQQTAATAISVEDLSHRFVEAGVEASPGRPPLALLVHGFLSAAECQSIVDRVANSFIPSDRLYPPSYRNNSLFDMFDAPFAEALYERMAPLLPTELVWPNRNTATAVLQDVELATWRPCSLNQLWRFSRYSNGQSFPPHLDGHYLPAPGLESKVSVTLYLNDNFEGGHTIFYSDKTLASEVLRVTPRTGTLALFDHDLWHDGSPVVCQLERKNHDKIILRSDVVFALQGAQPMSEERSLQLAERSERAAELIVAERPGGGVQLDYSKPTDQSPYSLLYHNNYIFQLLPLSTAEGKGGLLSASRDTTIADWIDGKVAQIYRGHTRSVLCLAPLGSVDELHSELFVSGSRDFSLRVWRRGAPEAVAVAHDAHDGNVLCVVECDPHPLKGAFCCLSGGADGFVRRWLIDGGGAAITCASENKLHSTWIHDMVWRRGVLYTASEDGTVCKWQLRETEEDFELVSSHELGVPVHVVVALDDGGIAVGDDGGYLTLFDDRFEVQARRRVHSRAVRAIVAVRPSEAQAQAIIASASDDGSIVLMLAALEGEPMASLSFHRNFIRSLCLLPNGRLASGSYDGRIKVWDFVPKGPKGGK
eukprot:Tamp_10614.p1 GENE.Tamp_10614~~Tamp_10614.p1  ORF type:complete len:618 (+),score=100.35 Tamp_10614:92-1945(+)